jgi:ABC-type branched-subunit amino acid transport system ATPase component
MTAERNPGEALLRIAGVSHRFGGLEVLRGVSFEVPRGSLTGLIGPNGAGKSTLFNIVSGFLAPKQGTVQFDGRDITRDSVQARSRAGLMRTFQTPQVFRNLTVRENLMMGDYRHLASGIAANMLRLRGSRAEMDRLRAKAEEACERFGLREAVDRPAGQVPAGIQRWVELARAWIGGPRLLLLDEPSSGLNTTEIVQLRAALQRLSGEGMSILLVSHDMGLVDVAQRVHVLCFGSIIASGAMQELQQDERVRQAYLGV